MTPSPPDSHRIPSRAGEEELEAVFRALPDLVLVVDAEGRYLSIVSGDRRQLYRPAEELTGRTFHEVFPADTADWFVTKIRETLDSDGRVSFRYPLEVDGRPEWFDAILVPMEGGRVLWVARNVTGQTQLEQQLAHATRLDALGRLAGGIAHDFNNLVMIMQGTASLVESRVEDEAILAELENIHEAAERASALTRQLLAFSRQQPLEVVSLVAQEVVVRMGRMLERIIGTNIELEILTSPEPGTIRMDPGQLEQIVMNLVVNASHAIEGAGGITVEVGRVVLEGGDEAVEAGVLQAGPHVSLEVRDTGRGMPPEIVARAFEPFFTTKSRGEGTGLGLSIVYGAVRQAGGMVEIESVPGDGTTVRVLFPEVPAAEGPEVWPGTREDSEPTGTVLVVEDESMVRELVVRLLEEAGHKVVAAEDGLEALARLEERPDVGLVVSDTAMPRMGGAVLLERLRELRPDLPVILMSGYAGDLPVGGDHPSVEAFLAKPFSRSALLGAVGRVLTDSAARA